MWDIKSLILLTGFRTNESQVTLFLSPYDMEVDNVTTIHPLTFPADKIRTLLRSDGPRVRLDVGGLEASAPADYLYDICSFFLLFS